MGYSGFQLHLGQSPCIIPPIVPLNLSPKLCSAGAAAEKVIAQLQDDVTDTRDNLLLAKVTQAHHARTSHGMEIMYNVGDRVMLSTFHQQCKYKLKGDKRAAKFFPQWDGLYTIIRANTEPSSYTLDNDNGYPYYASKLKPYYTNDAELFPTENTLNRVQS